MAEIVADWAKSSKVPQSRDDYAVLKASNPDVGRFQQLVDEATPGQPTTTLADRPDGPPWVSFMPVRRDDGVYCGLLVRDLSPDRDAFNRSILPATYFLMRYGETAKAAATYGALYAAARSAIEGLPFDSNRPVVLAVTPPDLNELARRIDAAGIGSIAVAAMLVAHGPVTLTRGESLPLMDRLAWLDTIVALLPYGFRASISAAAWTSGQHRIRLGFGTGGSGYLYAIGQKPDLSTYPREVAEAAKLLTEAQRHLGTPSILQFLWSETEPRDVNDLHAFAGVRAVAQQLAEIGQALAGVRQKAGSADAVRKVFDGRKSKSLKVRPDQLAPFISELVEPVLANPIPSDAEWLRPYWSAQLGSALAKAALRCHQRGDHAAVDRLLDLAAALGHLDEVIAASFKLDRFGGVAFLRRRQFDVAANGVTARHLRRDLAAVGELCRQELAESPYGAWSALNWLADDPEAHPWTRTVLEVVAQAPTGRTLEQSEVLPIWTESPPLGHAIVDVAVRRGLATIVLPNTWGLLFDQPAPELAAALRRQSDERPEILAQRDTVLLGLDQPVPFNVLATYESNATYMTMLRRLWEEPPLAQYRATLARRFIAATLEKIDLSKLDNRGEDWVKAAVTVGDDYLAAEVTNLVTAWGSSQTKRWPRFGRKSKLLTIVAPRSEKARLTLAQQDLQDVVEQAGGPDAIAAALQAVQQANGSGADVADVLATWARQRPAEDLHTAFLAAGTALDGLGGYFGLLREVCQHDQAYEKEFRRWAFAVGQRGAEQALRSLELYHNLVVFALDPSAIPGRRRSS